MKVKMIRTNLYLTKKQYKEVMKMAKKKEITFSDMFRRIVDYYLEEKELNMKDKVGKKEVKNEP